MIRSRLGLKALGLCAMLVGMFAFAGVAQAEVGAFWLVNGAKISESLLPTLLAETDTEASLLTTLGGREIHLRCKKVEAVEAHLVEPLGKLLGHLLFHECKFFALKGSVEEEQKACEPTIGANKGLIETNTITGLIKLHEPKAGVKETVIEATPNNAEGLFAKIPLGELCGFGENLKVFGKFFVKDCKGEALTDLVKHLIEELPALTKLTVNGPTTAATVHGSAWAFLGGVHKGLTFAAHAA
jgi:hypothetical protein